MNMALDPDPLTQLQKYIRTGNKNQILGPVMKDIESTIKAAKDVDPVIMSRFRVYQSQVMGLPQGPTEKMILAATEGFMKTMGFKGSERIDIMRGMMSWGYGSAMGFRPWIPARNTFQIFTMLAPRVGNNFVVEAMQDVVRDADGTLFNTLRAKGTILQRMPLFGADLVDEGMIKGFMTKFFHKGMQWYKNSDEFTRAVAYRSSERRFLDAAERLRKGTITTVDEFMDMSGLRGLAPDLRENARKMIVAKNWTGAKEMYCTALVEETMFPYRAGMGPTSFRGAVGKLFGMMGHYPVYYVENVRRAMRYATTPQKIAYATTFTANSMALYAGFKALGIKADNFLPWVPMTFSGGPYYQLMNQGLQTLDFRSYKGRQARGELLGITTKDGKLEFNPQNSELSRWVTPAGFEVNSIRRAANLANEGNVQAAVLALGSFPVDPALIQGN